ncbi:MAG: DUF2194 domain-containing protein [Ruminococcus sp.]|nr:DUF2194 domain-containing protein [Ruminococcus sp.]
MVSRRNYFAITIVMLVIFFLFQSTGVMTELWNDYEVNSYVKDMDELPGRSGAYLANEIVEDRISDGSEDLIVYIGREAMEDAVKVWASYTKKNMESHLSLQEYESTGWKGQNRIPDMLVIDPASIQWEEREELEYLEGCLEAGCNIIFCNMPEVSVIKKDQRIRSLFGIQNVREERAEVDGIHLYDGFLLGGEAVYLASDEKERKKRQDMELTLPWYELEAGTAVYMKGIVEDEGIESEEYPVIIWKKNYRKACVMAVNGTYMEEFGGIGLLSAMSAQMKFYDLYPVVNAQNLVAAGFPILAQENGSQLMKIYSRNMQGVMRDVLWPGIMTVYRENKMGLSCMLAFQMDYADEILPDAKQFRYYMKNFNKEDVEAGISGVDISNTSLDDKLKADDGFVKEVLPDYQFTSFYTGNLQEKEIEAAMDEQALSSVRTVITEDQTDNEIVGYLSEHVTKQKVLANGFSHTYRDDFRVRCVETMLGYTNVLMDIKDAVYPEEEQESWEKLAENLGWNIRNYWKGFQGFQGTTVSESDEHIRRFLALDYTQEREGQEIYLRLSDTQKPVWFVLRTHQEAIDQIKGGSFTELEDDVYLLEIEAAEAVITMKSTVLTY